jgi:mannose-6-phosphate isomerase
MIVGLGHHYPGDIGGVIALLLNLVHLQPGQALYLGAGNMHAYLHGVGIEIMANSDNVLRGGLTAKHIDVPELMAVVDFTPLPDPLVTPTITPFGRSYPTPAPEFHLTRLDLRGHDLEGRTLGPAIALCTDGDAGSLRKGQAGYLRAGSEWSFAGTATVFLATPGAPTPQA